MSCLEFFVPGLPKGAGSKHGFAVRKKNQATGQLEYTGKVVLIDTSGEAGKDWRATVSFCAFKAMQEANLKPFEQPLAAFFNFTLPRPKSHFLKSGLRPNAPEYHSSPPDLTKLVRQVEDSMLGKVYIDDRIIVSQTASKKYGEQPGCHIRIIPV